MRLAVAQHSAPAVIRAQPAADIFALCEELNENEDRRQRWEAALAGMTLN